MNFDRQIDLEPASFHWLNLVKLHPLPWRLERMNDHGVTVSDCRGAYVLELEYSEQGPDMSSATYENGVTSDRGIALLLVAMSLVENGNPFFTTPERRAEG